MSPRVAFVGWACLVCAACTEEPATVPHASAGGAGVPAIQAGAGGSSHHAGAPPTVASGGASAGEAGESNAGQAGQGGAAPGDCDPSAAAGLHVFSAAWDPFGYPPYALDDCTLVYVSSADEALHVRSLKSGDERVLESSESHPRRPTIAGGVIAWESDSESSSRVNVWLDGSSAAPRHIESAGEPRATVDAVAFTRFLGPAPHDDTDVYLFDLATGEEEPIATGPGQQRFADISRSHVAVTDFSEGSGYFDEVSSIADIVVIERATLARTVRALPGKQAFPLLGSEGLLVYQEWGAVHPEPKFGRFLLKAGRISEPVSADFNVKQSGEVKTNTSYVRPSLHGLDLDFVDTASGATALYRAKLGAGPSALLMSTQSPELYGPVAGRVFTLVAMPALAKTLQLVVVAR